MRMSLFFLRVALGWMYLYAGASKIMDPAWSAEGYLKSAKTFPSLYQWFASPGVLPVINLLNEWGLLLIGAFLLLGVFTRQMAVLA
ncbi:MAG: DoxX family membrane protein, partial [Candidatus Wildermuthbacteria bacterium]|nr:DoxX family membrane protein [Candidatus Wildermuthbacteria bacterium]